MLILGSFATQRRALRLALYSLSARERRGPQT